MTGLPRQWLVATGLSGTCCDTSAGIVAGKAKAVGSELGCLSNIFTASEWTCLFSFTEVMGGWVLKCVHTVYMLLFCHSISGNICVVQVAFLLFINVV